MVVCRGTRSRPPRRPARLMGSDAMAGSGVRGAGRSVASKIAGLLGAFSQVHPELSLAELSRLADIPLSTTYRLATELGEWGGLERAEGGGYRIGPRRGGTGSAAPPGTSR